MSKNKLTKFSELSGFPNSYQNYNAKNNVVVDFEGKQVELASNWASHFGNGNPIILELACGRGEYSVGLSRMYPENNFIGIDIKGARLWKGARQAIQEGLSNAAFFRTRIEKVDVFFGRGEISGIWITFPDPFLKKPNRRLTAGIFLSKYQQFLKPGAPIHLKTDSQELFDFSLRSLEVHGCKLEYVNDDIYSGQLALEELSIETYYELLHKGKGKTIKYLRFTLPEEKIVPVKLADPPTEDQDDE